MQRTRHEPYTMQRTRQEPYTMQRTRQEPYTMQRTRQAALPRCYSILSTAGVLQLLWRQALACVCMPRRVWATVCLSVGGCTGRDHNALFNLMRATERLGIVTRFPHHSHLYRIVVDKTWWSGDRRLRGIACNIIRRVARC